MTPEQLTELADDLHAAPREVAAAIALVRTGRIDLVTEVIAGRMTVHKALTTARAGKKN
jgi:hypothetical protein